VVLSGRMSIGWYEAIFVAVGTATIGFMVLVVACAGGNGPCARFTRADAPPDTRCPVCASTDRRAWVSCVKCETPHHAECVRYAQKCAVFGCTPDTGAAPKKVRRDVGA
jgi:hypothetical protein